MVYFARSGAGTSVCVSVGSSVGRIAVSVGGTVVGVSGRLAGCTRVGSGALHDIKRRENKNMNPRRDEMFLRMGRIVLSTRHFVNS